MNPYRRCVLLTYRFLTYVADLNYIMLLFDVRLGWVTCDYISRRLGWVKSVKSWVGLGWVGLQKMDPRPCLVSPSILCPTNV